MAGKVGWKDEYALGIPEMDAEHHRIFDWLERLEEAAASDSQVDDLMEAGRKDSVYHFGHEEKFLDSVGYPGLVKQRVQHKQFLSRLDRLESDARDQDGRLTPAQVHDLQSWLMGHIVGLDREYAEFLEQKESQSEQEERRTRR